MHPYAQSTVRSTVGLQPTPVLVSGGHNFASVIASYWHTCGVTTDGDTYCWGWNNFGQVGNGSFTYIEPTPIAVSGGHTFQSISSELHTTCGLTTTGQAYCWGYNERGMLGIGSIGDNHNSPQPVTGGHTFQSLEAGWYVTCGVTPSQAAYCWGMNSEGGVGAGYVSTTDPKSEPSPVAVTGGHLFSMVRIGYTHVCGVTAAGDAFCWGRGKEGQLGNGATNTANPTPLAVSGGHTFSSIELGRMHTCGLTIAGDLYCWGRNRDGQLGDGTFYDRLTPVFVLNLGSASP